MAFTIYILNACPLINYFPIFIHDINRNFDKAVMQKPLVEEKHCVTLTSKFCELNN
jgi:hypothetical protein